MTTLMLKPARADLVVLRPDGQRLAEQGEPVAESVYWARRLADGDVVHVQPDHAPSPVVAATPPAPAPKPKPKG